MTELYPYQKRVLASIQRGRNVIIQAPTGAGKTLAALYPFFQTLNRHWGQPQPEQAPLPLTCRYAVPMRVLANQFRREFDTWFTTLDQKRGTDFNRTYVEKLGLKLPAIQTGEQPEDARFESPLTFCTIDQLLASFIGSPYSLSRSQANLNVGAVAGSYLILDEFHLYPLDKGQGARLTTLAMLRLLKGFAPFCLMTATFSTALLDELGQLLDADIIRVEDATELATIMDGRQRTIQRMVSPMTPVAILEAHASGRARGAGASLVVCNTVARAQDLYVGLRDELARRGEHDGVRLKLLHSRFTSEDRRAKSEVLEAWLGKDQWRDGTFQGPDTIIIGTQVVEVGLNISAGMLHTELAPANSIIQRVGRCARFAQQQGAVYVYPLPLNSQGKPATLPYDPGLCQVTFDHLPEIPQRFDFPQEQELIDAVHTAEDRQMLATFLATSGRTEDLIRLVLTDHERGHEGDLIRNVSQVTIVVHPDPKAAITRHPYDWEGFGIFPESLVGAYQALEQRRQGIEGLNWTMCQLREVGEVDGEDEADNSRERQYTWEIIANSSQIRTATRVALPPELATYDADLGFRLLLDAVSPTGTYMSKAILSKRSLRDDQEPGKQGSYVAHISGLMRAYHFSVRQDVAWLHWRLEGSLGLAHGSLDRAIRLAIACHDIGKLSRQWQAWANAWQAILVQQLGPAYQVKAENVWLAKTDRHPDWRQERALQRQVKPPRPHHACEGVVASAMFIAHQVLANVPEDEAIRYVPLAQAVTSAIARHHAPTARTYQHVDWDPAALTAIRAALQACHISTDHLNALEITRRSGGELEEACLFVPSFSSDNGGPAAVWLAFAIVRALRLCDQRAEREL